MAKTLTFNPKALAEQIKILQANETLSVSTAFDRPYINYYIEHELKRLEDAIPSYGEPKEFKVLEFFGNDERWFDYSDLITHPDEVTDEFNKASVDKYHLTVNLDKSIDIDTFQLVHDYYDLIVCPQVLCYSLNPIAMLTNLRAMLKSGGRLILTTSGPCYPDFYGTGFTLFYTLEAIEKLCLEVFGIGHLEKKRAYGNTEHAMRTLAYVNHGELKDKDFEHRENCLSLIVAATCIK